MKSSMSKATHFGINMFHARFLPIAIGMAAKKQNIDR